MPPPSSNDLRREPYLSTVLSPSSHKIIATANARVYHTPFGSSNRDWTYSKIKGILVFGRDRDTAGADKSNASLAQGYRLQETYWFRLVDTVTDRVVWMLRVPEVFEYNKDRPFFHVFSGSSRMFGFCFDDDSEAGIFFTKVTDRTSRPKPASRPRVPSNSTANNNGKSRVASRTGRIHPSIISPPVPSSFVHVAHVGIGANGIIETSKDLDPSWAMLVKDLQGYGISQDVVAENLDFVEGFLAGAKLTKGTTTKNLPDIPRKFSNKLSSNSSEKRRFFRRKPIQSNI